MSNSIKTQSFFPDFVLQEILHVHSLKKKLEKIISILEKIKLCFTFKRIEHEHPYRAKKLNNNSNKFNSFLKNINVGKFMSRQDL